MASVARRAKDDISDMQLYIIKRSLGAAKIPGLLESCTISRSDGKCPDGASLIP